jgi:hypothetical protein
MAHAGGPEPDSHLAGTRPDGRHVVAQLDAGLGADGSQKGGSHRVVSLLFQDLSVNSCCPGSRAAEFLVLPASPALSDHS